VGRGVGFEPGELPEVVDRVPRVSRPSSDPQKEQPPAAFPYRSQRRRQMFDRKHAERAGHLNSLVAILLDASPAHRPVAHHPSRHRSFKVLSASTTFFSRKALLFPCSRSIRSIGTSMKVGETRRLLTSTSA